MVEFARSKDVAHASVLVDVDKGGNSKGGASAAAPARSTDVAETATDGSGDAAGAFPYSMDSRMVNLERKLEMDLTNMGFPRLAVINAIKVCDLDRDRCIDHLLAEAGMSNVARGSSDDAEGGGDGGVGGKGAEVGGGSESQPIGRKQRGKQPVTASMTGGAPPCKVKREETAEESSSSSSSRELAALLSDQVKSGKNAAAASSSRSGDEQPHGDGGGEESDGDSGVGP